MVSSGGSRHLGTRPRDCGYRGDPGLEGLNGEVGVLVFLPVLGRPDFGFFRLPLALAGGVGPKLL